MQTTYGMTRQQAELHYYNYWDSDIAIPIDDGLLERFVLISIADLRY